MHEHPGQRLPEPLRHASDGRRRLRPRPALPPTPPTGEPAMWVLQGMRKSTAMNDGVSPLPGTRRGQRSLVDPLFIAVSFRPAIPRRVAPQQSPPPLHQPTPLISLSHAIENPSLRCITSSCRQGPRHEPIKTLANRAPSTHDPAIQEAGATSMDRRVKPGDDTGVARSDRDPL
jgi:hypothetical protein